MKRSILLAIAVASLVKLSFALFTIGTSDVATWRSFADSVQACGSCVYQSVGPYGDRFNHPPFIIYFLKLIAGADRLFPFWLRLPSILADIGSVLLIRKMLPKVSVSLLILLSLNHVSILVSGFHGNTDPLMIFFVVLTLYLFSIKRVGWAGAAFGMAINIKIVPLLVVPAVFFYLRGWKARTIFCSVAVFVVLVLSAPYVFNSPLAIIKGTLGYSGMYGKWGTSRILIAFPLSKTGHDTASLIFRLIIVAVTLLGSYSMSKRGVHLFCQIGFILFLFFFLTPSLGVQYLVWTVPFVLALGLQWSIAYYASAGLHLFLTYNYWSHGQWYFADSHIEPQWSAGSYMAGFLCWAICGLICLRYKHLVYNRHEPFDDFAI